MLKKLTNSEFLAVVNDTIIKLPEPQNYPPDSGCWGLVQSKYSSQGGLKGFAKLNMSTLTAESSRFGLLINGNEVITSKDSR